VSGQPIPVLFDPLFKPKPWGGRMLEALFSKPLPPGVPIGESWELSGLPGDETRVRGGPLDGLTVSALAARWGLDLYGTREPAGGQFPLLVKFLDAREPLSVQVHPRPGPPGTQVRGLKHEAWYVVSAKPDAGIFIGLKPGVSPADLARAAGTRATEELLQHRPVSPGDCFYLPSGIVHALGAGVVVAEVQTPSDITYRLYDWGRTDAAGRSRELHIEQALQNALFEVPEHQIVRCPPAGSGAGRSPRRLVTCERFLIDRLDLPAGTHRLGPHPGLRVWIVLTGGGRIVRTAVRVPFVAGDVLLIPAAEPGAELTVMAGCTLLEVTIPVAGAGPEDPAGPGA
jgi:mannose-6-phosphate isomerase